MTNQSCLSDDGLYTPEVREWSEKKYELVRLYAEIFSKAMKNKWDKRIYIDLFCGAGKAKIKESNKIVYSSSLISLTVPELFDKYIFCDKDKKCIDALESRVKSLNTDKDVHFILGDCNEKVKDIVNNIKNDSKSFISFCFVDPFSLGNLCFSTIKTLSSLKIDFLILLPSGFDARRNEYRYFNQEESNFDKFLGTNEWRQRWIEQKTKMKFTEFFIFIREYNKQMKTLGYPEKSPDKFIETRSGHLFLYHLAFFSKHPLGHKIWNDVKKYSPKQTSINF